jgi:hypothetical protein
MPTENERRSRNAFTAGFLSSLDEIGEPDGAHEADVAGPWVIVPVRHRAGSAFAVLREWESLGDGDVPYAIFERRETALLAAAMLPATGREPLFRLATDPEPGGFPLWIAGAAAARRAGSRNHSEAESEDASGSRPDGDQESSGGLDLERRDARSDDPACLRSEPAGHLRDFDEGLALALNLAAAVVRSPRCLALLLESAGSVALEQAGRILHRRIQQQAAGAPAPPVAPVARPPRPT